MTAAGAKQFLEIIPEMTTRTGENYQPIKDKHRSLEICVANATANSVLYEVEDYFDSGEWFCKPMTRIRPWQVAVGTCANKAGSILCGVSTGVSYQIGNSGRYLNIAFTNPQAGCIKTWIKVEESQQAKKANKEANDPQLKYSEEKGFTVIADVQESRIAHHRMVFFISDRDQQECRELAGLS